MSDAILIAHGAPANPGPQEARMRALAVEAGVLLPGWRLRGATLAAEGALAAALQGFDAPLIYPFFMSEGWFTSTALPRALERLGAHCQQLRPFGTDPGLPELVEQSALSAGIEPVSTTLLLAAHGSQVSPASKRGAEALVARLRSRFFDVRLGLIEEPPFLADAARIVGPALCLPFFALRAGHVETDIPAALAQANFTGPILPPIGEHAGVPALIARALARA